VGLAAYAAAAIAESPPIPTGIQGFLYDIRTAILPFMFIFNHDLILHDIDSFPMAIMIFVTACIGNFAFASATQGWLRTNNRWYEIPFMLCITLVMLRPDATADLLGVPHEQRYWCCLIGIALFGLLYLAQGPRARANNPKRVAAW
jgi:TRAP-type uncharacterized transport system fused permease subunit